MMKLRNHRISLLAFVLVWVSLTGSALSKDVDEIQRRRVPVLEKKSKIIFLISKDLDNYEADKTIPVFANMLKKKYGYDVTVLLGSGAHGSYQYPNMEIISEADLLIVFARRLALPTAQMKALKNYLNKGKPLLGIRTANHAFTAREKIEEGYEDWPEFVSDILGCENRGYGPVAPGTDVSIIPENAGHPILKNIKPAQWHSTGNVYLVAPLLDNDATILLTGKVNDISQPIAWTRKAKESKVFYTSLGFPTDFQTPQFTELLTNAISWALSKDS